MDISEYSGKGGNVRNDWLSPSEALSRFKPAESIRLAEAVEKEQARYGFRVGTLGMLIKQGCGSEVLMMPDIWRLPGSPPWLLGLINLRGNLVPVYELKDILNAGKILRESKKMVLIFDQGEKAVGIVIDDFPKPLISLSALPNLPQLPTVLKGHIRKGFVRDDEIWLEFDQDSFFDELTRSGS